MDVMVHDTLFTDHFVCDYAAKKLPCTKQEEEGIEAVRQLLYSYDAITKLNLKKNRRRQGPAKDKTNVENILLALHRCRSGLPTFCGTQIPAEGSGSSHRQPMRDQDL